MINNFSSQIADQNLQRNRDWFNEFRSTDNFQRLSHEEQRAAFFVTQAFSEMNYVYFSREPKDWSVENMKRIVGVYFPSMITALPEFFTSVGPILQAFLGFLQQTGKIKNGDELARHVRQAAKSGAHFADFTDSWSEHKKMGMQVIDGEVKFPNKRALANFVADFNFGVPLVGVAEGLPEAPSNVIAFSDEQRARAKERLEKRQESVWNR
ncbi:hypothetical protein [Levilactobacillus bambusae]|uniref:Uncharacterized protein n=1 Tax=Levilactobacillus bambusae TaxID=2024736 RepID=A0A2V1N095_9LACO|nr:hypothetical protein [Levilactobacillus bambusae]PWF99795.1 hypothetical protein DCM90_06965 [Levilactobacillus bambusae]